jgi:hypothetical protein
MVRTLIMNDLGVRREKKRKRAEQEMRYEVQTKPP